MSPHSPPAKLWLSGVALIFGCLIASGSSRILTETSTADKPQCTKVSDTDFFGADIAKLANVSSFSACCNRCGKNPDCHRWTYNPENKRCWLKRATGWVRKTDRGKISGRVIRAGAATLPDDIAAPTPNVASSGAFSRANYSEVLGLNWLFYEAQRSGELPADHRVPWRRPSHLTDAIPGGWYDAGDYLKLSYTTASAATFLAWGMLEFKDGYETAGQTEHAMTNLRVAADYLARCHVAPRRYVGQIGHPDIDHDFWGRADQQKSARPAYVYDSTTPAADLYSKVAAALASGALVWRTSDPDFSANILRHARDMYDWAEESQGQGKYSNFYKSATHSIYPSSDSYDDMAFAAYWLYKATGTRQYLEDSVRYWKKKGWGVTAGWDDVGAAATVALANLVDDGVDVPDGDKIKDWALNDFLKSWAQPRGEIRSTPKGMHYPRWSKWGNLQLSTTAALMAATQAKHSKNADTRQLALQFARSQVDYALGAGGRSFVVGWGEDPPQRAHHAGASCPDRPAKCDWDTFSGKQPNGQVLYGALVAGPEGPGDNSYRDQRDDYVSNEVSLGYNAGFAGALAALVEMA